MLCSCEPSRRCTAVESSSAIRTTGSMVEVAAIRKRSAMRDVPCVVKHDRPIMPIESPVAPSPAKTPEETQSESHAKGNSCSREIEARIRIPAGPPSDRRAIHKPRIVFWYIDHIRGYRFDGDVLPLFGY